MRARLICGFLSDVLAIRASPSIVGVADPAPTMGQKISHEAFRCSHARAEYCGYEIL
jgi:hypothetical protein